MNPNVLVAAITAAGGIAVAITALLLNSRGFTDLGVRIADLGGRMDRLDRRLDVIEADLKEFNKILWRHDADIDRLKDKTGLN
jgi:poly-gamma-glutamate capsule biosynthesis protein CapA/YwtB (metallophosphatase superfamily)